MYKVHYSTLQINGTLDLICKIHFFDETYIDFDQIVKVSDYNRKINMDIEALIIAY